MWNSKESGFSLIELLVVLAAISFILLISHHHYSNRKNEQDFKLWYQQFELDLILLQKQTMITNDYHALQFRSSLNIYDLRDDPFSSPQIRREIPEHWKLSMNTLNNPIRFTHEGNIRNPGTMRIEIGKNRYFIYFPFGKGRSYYVKNQ
ncbi:prepilin-type N-terminal cleavage/methylation domain-containing protein [Amphibacillus sp. Q70]|uniref:prepilin-type N-terminal cleavage/methylation domain-containing protein n=1 Tax=Amphibacillus sp. Q70 TaxID=3453416 RepID=UPI003F86E239